MPAIEERKKSFPFPDRKGYLVGDYKGSLSAIVVPEEATGDDGVAAPIVGGNKKPLRRKGKGGWRETRGKFNKGKPIRKCNNWIFPSRLMSEAISGCCT